MKAMPPRTSASAFVSTLRIYLLALKTLQVSAGIYVDIDNTSDGVEC